MSSWRGTTNLQTDLDRSGPEPPSHPPLPASPLSARRQIRAGSRIRNAAYSNRQRIAAAIKNEMILPLVRSPGASELHCVPGDGSTNRAAEPASCIVHAPRNLSSGHVFKFFVARNAGGVYMTDHTEMNGLTFLLVEDSDSDALLVKMEMARHADIRLIWVHDGQEAIDYLLGEPPFNDRAQYPLPDMIMLDLKMPRMSGFDVLQWRQQQAPVELRVIPVLVMSGSDLQQDAWRAYSMGANRYMTKPGNLGIMRRRIDLMVENWGEHTVLVKPDTSRSMISERRELI